MQKDTKRDTMDFDRKLRSLLPSALVDEILIESKVREFSKGTEILRDQQYVKVLPIVISGLVKVYSRFEEKELLLYYIEPAQSCIMTFYAALKNTPSRVFAVAEEVSQVLLIPVHLLPRWLKDYPDLNELFYYQFNLRYSELLDSIGHLLLDRMDKRLYNHLKRKLEMTGSSSIKMSHNQIANELGTAREVITRAMKKLEIDGKVSQNAGQIRIVSGW